MFRQPTLIVVGFFVAFTTCGANETPVQFVGCYSSSQAGSDSHAYLVDPLTWKVCVRFCLEKNVKYAGIEAILTRKSRCHCSNTLAPQPGKVAPHLCDEECYGDKTKTCGGTGFFSMYQIQKAVASTFMVATDNGIAYLREKVLSPNFVSLPKTSTIKLVYHYSENQVYFVLGNKILRTEYKALLMEYMPTVVLVHLSAAASSLALDWLSHKLYWTLPNKLVESNLDGSARREIAHLKSSTKDLAIDPFERKLFFIQQGTIQLYDLKASKIIETNILKFNCFEEVTCMTLDVQKRTVYAVGFYKRRRRGSDADGYLVSTDYHGSTFGVLLRRRELSGAFSLNALDGQVFWAEVHQKVKVLYSYRVPSTNEGLGNPKQLLTLATYIQDVKLYDQRVQISQKEYLCKKKRCSHICSLISTTIVKCSCPEDWQLKADQRSCRENKETTMRERFTEDDKSFDLDVSSVEVREKNKKKKRRKYRKYYRGKHESSDSD